eukprot:8384640-Karenia_brevis.AAC.1
MFREVSAQVARGAPAATMGLGSSSLGGAAAGAAGVPIGFGGATGDSAEVSRLKKELAKEKKKRGGDLQSLLLGAAKKRSKDEEDEDAGPSQGFSLASTAANGLTLESVAASCPGTLYDSGLKQIAKAMCQRSGGSLDEQDTLSQRVEAYLKCVVHGKYPVHSMNQRDAREMDL